MGLCKGIVHMGGKTGHRELHAEQRQQVAYAVGLLLIATGAMCAVHRACAPQGCIARMAAAFMGVSLYRARMVMSVHTLCDCPILRVSHESTFSPTYVTRITHVRCDSMSTVHYHTFGAYQQPKRVRMFSRPCAVFFESYRDTQSTFAVHPACSSAAHVRGPWCCYTRLA